ncbi:hypothetical protein BKA62DRAFT_16899 [Auriculariales sp. MPI-PUGE-AT-0066]|nr:hypothetical protein BKA62DRAFT_16899 [Auriculariales sp. MPI-PUGE-AT-0066]
MHSGQTAIAACAECKRLKLRCDKKIPCSTCVRRRCVHLCPDGELVKGQGRGKRLVMEDARVLQNRIDAMQKRLAALNAAIAGLRSEGVDQDDAANLVPSFGTLSIGCMPRFNGRNAASTEIMASEGDAPALPGLVLPTNRNNISGVAGLCFDELCGALTGNNNRLLLEYPPLKESEALVDIFFNAMPWLIGTLDEQDIRLATRRVRHRAGERPSTETLHLAAVTYGIFSIACIFDPDSRPRMVEGRRYYDLAGMCLSAGQAIQQPTVNAIRAINIMAWFIHVYDDIRSMSVAYRLMGLAAQLCRTLGLHRDDREWNLSLEEKQIRRAVLWDTFCYSSWAAETCGRPPAFSMAHVDARLPVDEGAFVDDNGTWQQSYLSWSRVFSGSCLLRVIDQAFGPQEATYATILRLDTMLRGHRSAVHLDPDVEDAEFPLVKDQALADALRAQRVIIALHQHKLLCVLHRAHFAQAMFLNPSDPLNSPYRESVINAFRSALQLSWCIVALKDYCPAAHRLPITWAVTFSVAVLFCAVVIQSPQCSLAPTAWQEFNRLSNAIGDIFRDNPQKDFFLASLHKLRSKAELSLAASGSFSANVNINPPVTLDEEEIAFIFGGTLTKRETPPTSERASSSPEESQTLPPQEDFIGMSAPLLGEQRLLSPSSARLYLGEMHLTWEAWIREMEEKTGASLPLYIAPSF